MPIVVTEWWVENYLIFSKGVGIMTLEDMQENNRRITALLDAGTAPVNIIMDATEILKVEGGLPNLPKSTTFSEHPNAGWIISINNTRFFNFISNILYQTRKSKGRVVSNFEEAVKLALYIDSRLTHEDLSVPPIP